MASDCAISAAKAEKYEAVKTSVWWDTEECQIPKNFDMNVIAQNIKTVLLKMNYRGPVSFLVYVDTTRIPPLIRQACERTGISLCHVPAGLKDARDKKMLVDMLVWAVDNPAPANYLLISGEKDFSNALDQLEARGYNILLAHPPHTTHALFPVAKSVWRWTSLLSGGFPYASGESYPKMLQGQASDVSRMNQTAFPNPEKPPPAQIKWAPHEIFEVSKPKSPESLIPILFPRARIPDMLENIDGFNALRRQRNIEYAQKVSMLKNRNEECQPRSEYKSTGICIALHYMRQEKMIPTKENIQDFIRYDDPDDRNFDVEEALKHELEHDMVVTQNLGDLPLYLPKNWYLWECVNPEGGHQDQYAKTTWDAIENFLGSLDGRIEMIISNCRFEACLVLKNSCFRNMPLGRVQQIMNMILEKGWILPFPDGWNPVTITLERKY